MIRSEALLWAHTQLEKAGMVDARREARYLLQLVLQCDGAALITQANAPLTEDEEYKLQQAVKRRAAFEPLARIKGTHEFWGLDFLLNEATLIPRPDSECLIEKIISLFGDKNQTLHILDMGTGTGCLLISLLGEYKQATGWGTDISPRALQAAQQNAAQNGVGDRAQFIQTDWAKGVGGPFDIIISNPPYIRSDVIATLEAGVRDYDPHTALYGGADGLAAYRVLLPQAYAGLKEGGLCLVEIGFDQAEAVQILFNQNGFTDIFIEKDLGGNPRMVGGKKPAA